MITHHLWAVGAAIPAIGEGGVWLPRAASTTASEVDWLFHAITSIAIFFFILITALTVAFVWKYRARPGHTAQPSADHNQPLEITWTVIPLAIVVWIFWEGFSTYLDMSTPPQNAYEIQVLGQKWSWNFTYPNGYVDPQLHVPADTNVRLVMTSQDVIHSLYIPAFRVKRDVVPGRYAKLWFRAPEPGSYDLFCAEYCGTSHSTMITKVVVHPPGEFEKWLENASNFIDKLPPEKLWEAGQTLYKQRGCQQCHSVDGKSGIGPSFRGLWGRTERLTTGGAVAVDENYVRTSIVEPQAAVVAGFDPVMPTYKGRLKDKEITALIEYIKTLKE